jgi:tetraacyldisaccharide 4'-kinase
MRAPAFWQTGSFWQTGGPLAWLLSPLGSAYAAVTASRVARDGWRAPVPVICCGNASAGGAGKTTVALDLGGRLLAHGRAVAFLTRGYGGRATVPLRVDLARHHAEAVGDEALLLAALAPTWVAADRAAGARAAVAAGAQVLVMDDGLQNPTLAKTLSLLVIDGAAGFGNGRVIPAGPLREPVAAAASRCRAAVLIGADAAHACAQLPPALPVLRAELRPAPEIAAVIGQRVLAFAGIGRPEKFFAMLAAAGVVVAHTVAFPDHHRYTRAELDRLLATAARLDAVPVTTPKDAARLSPADRARVAVVGVRLAWQDAAALAALLADLG